MYTLCDASKLPLTLKAAIMKDTARDTRAIKIVYCIYTENLGLISKSDAIVHHYDVLEIKSYRSTQILGYVYRNIFTSSFGQTKKHSYINAVHFV